MSVKPKNTTKNQNCCLTGEDIGLKLRETHYILGKDGNLFILI